MYPLGRGVFNLVILHEQMIDLWPGPSLPFVNVTTDPNPMKWWEKISISDKKNDNISLNCICLLKKQGIIWKIGNNYFAPKEALC